MSRTTENKWLTAFAVLTTICTLFLIAVGGLVTSHGVGMAVPDWPTTYGYNMFFFPFEKWTGGIFYEHSHRLVASGVGFLTMILAGWLWWKEDRRWMRWLGVVALLAVIAQGVMGGLRVTLYKNEIGIFHATFAQLFLLLVAAISLFLSPFWRGLPSGKAETFHPWFGKFVLGSTLLIIAQLSLGATMRHQHAGLAVPDFPLAHGKFYPPTDAAFIEKYNQSRLDGRDYEPVTATQIHLHMAHRITALLILVAVGVCWGLSRRQAGAHHTIGPLAAIWFGVILAQAALGAWTVLSNKAADIATAHVVLGAGSLLIGGILYMITARVSSTSEAGVAAGEHVSPVLERQPVPG
jgi:heme a synthase